MKKLFSVCFVIQDRMGGYVEPTIYFTLPKLNPADYKIHTFRNPFEAKAFLKEEYGDGAEIEVDTGANSPKRVANF